MEIIKHRILVSFDEQCPYQCKHCYTLDIPRYGSRSMEEIVNSIDRQSFDIVYVSQRRENFENPLRGLSFCRKLFERYKSHIIIITRNVFSGNAIEQLLDLSSEMKKEGKILFFAVSVFATASFSISENPYIVPSPYERINFLHQLSQNGIPVIAMIRPIFPDKIIPITEVFEIIDLCKNDNICIVSSGLAINDNILWRLGITKDSLVLQENFGYLEGVMEGNLSFVDVSNELNLIQEHCQYNKIPFFSHSMQAINFINKQKKDF